MQSDIALLHDSSSTETMTAVYSTGIIDISRYDRPVNIRRINMHYESSTNFVCRIYGDGHTDSNQICSVTFPHNVSGGGPRIVSLRPAGGARAKSIVIKITTGEVFGVGTIRKLEVETDE